MTFAKIRSSMLLAMLPLLMLAAPHSDARAQTPINIGIVSRTVFFMPLWMADQKGYLKHEGFDTKIVRIFNTYGPRMRLNDGRALPNFLFQALTNQPLTVYGDGRQTRSFCYVSDLIEGIYRLLESSEHEPVNIGNPQEITIKEFADRILALTGSPAPLEFRPLPQDDPKQRCPDIAKARRILKWEPRVNLDEGLRLTLKYFQKRVAETRRS